MANADFVNSDGIARVHGMNNVQAEELVEYGEISSGFHAGTLTFD